MVTYNSFSPASAVVEENLRLLWRGVGVILPESLEYAHARCLDCWAKWFANSEAAVSLDCWFLNKEWH